MGWYSAIKAVESSLPNCRSWMNRERWTEEDERKDCSFQFCWAEETNDPEKNSNNSKQRCNFTLFTGRIGQILFRISLPGQQKFRLGFKHRKANQGSFQFGRGEK